MHGPLTSPERGQVSSFSRAPTSKLEFGDELLVHAYRQRAWEKGLLKEAGFGEEDESLSRTDLG